MVSLLVEVGYSVSYILRASLDSSYCGIKSEGVMLFLPSRFLALRDDMRGGGGVVMNYCRYFLFKSSLNALHTVYLLLVRSVVGELETSSLNHISTPQDTCERV